MEKLKEAILNGENAFITGGGGVGKTWTVNEVLKSMPRAFAMTASTGCASNHINGETYHKFLGIGGYQKLSDLDYLKKKGGWGTLGMKLGMVSGIIIDEASMLRSDTFDLINAWLKFVLRNDAPFGGKQIILVGDLLQIPPVVKKEDKIEDYWFFQSDAFKEANFHIHNLTEVKRQEDVALINALNEVRLGDCSPVADTLFKNREVEPEDGAMILCSRNKQVDIINERELSKLDAYTYKFKASISYHEDIINKAERGRLYYKVLSNTIVDENIILKAGCKVLIADNCMKGSYVNGNIGTFLKYARIIDTSIRKYENLTYFCDDHRVHYTKEQGGIISFNDDESIEYASKFYKNFCPQEVLIVELGEGKQKRKVFVKKSSNFFIQSTKHFDTNGVPEKDVVMTQFPIKLGYAITIHKAQGMTLERVLVDCNQMFAYGQVYVGLSRAKTLEGLYVKNWNKNLIKADPKAVEFYRGLR